MSLKYMTNSADTCRTNGIVAGTRLVGDEGYGPTTIEVLYIGQSRVFARVISTPGGRGIGRESLWTLGHWRDWQVVAP